MGQDKPNGSATPIVGDPDLVRLAAEGAALVLVAANGTDVLWASPAGAQMIGAPYPVNGFRFSTGLAPIERLVNLASETAPVEGARLERLRFVNGRQLSVVTVAARRALGPDGRPLLMLTFAGQRGAPASLPDWLTDRGNASPGETPPPAPEAAQLSRLRFTYRLDAEFRFDAIDDSFTAILPDGFVLVGRSWSELIATGVIDEGDRMGAALAARETFHALPVQFPSRIGVWLEVALSGTPIHNPATGFAGFRGFGLCIATTRPIPISVTPPAADEAEPCSTPDAKDTIAIAEPRIDVNDEADDGKLSKSEREAFRQIARALGAFAAEDTARSARSDDDVMGDAASLATQADETAAAAAQESIDATARVHSHVQPPIGEDGIEDGEFIEIDERDIIALPSLQSDETVAARDADSLAENATRLLDRLPIGIVVSRGDVPIIMNRTMLDMIAYRDIDEFFDSGGLDAMFRGRSADQIGMAAKGGDIALLRSDGGVVAAEARMQTIQWGDLPATLMIFRRPSEQDEGAGQATLELELRRRETELQELHAVLDTATDGIVMLDGDGRIMAMNRSAEALFGYDQNEVAGEAFITLLAPESHAAAIDYVEGLRAGGVAAVLNDGRELLGRERQGGSIPLFTTIGRIGTEHDPKYCIVMRDITPWKRAEADLIAAKRSAESANAQKSDFLARMSHEIRTPMSAIMGFAEVMLDERFGPIGNERYRDYLKDMHTSGAHVISLINDLLDISKIEAGRADLNFIRLDLNAAASNAANLMQNEARRARVILRMNLEERLPAIVADDRSIRQIFLNLISNAIKFSEAGGQIIVSTTLSERGEVVLRIRDNGIGMREEDIATALEPFRQVGTARRNGGTGLGLPLTKALVEANRAALSIRSAPDKGTLVEVTFPPNRVLAE